MAVCNCWTSGPECCLRKSRTFADIPQPYPDPFQVAPQSWAKQAPDWKEPYREVPSIAHLDFAKPEDYAVGSEWDNASPRVCQMLRWSDEITEEEWGRIEAILAKGPPQWIKDL